MRRFRWIARVSSLGSVLVLSVLPPALAGCGGDDDAPESEPRPPETAEQVPDLPPGWTVVSNTDQGFALGAPPGWVGGRECDRAAAATVLCSPDELVTLSVSADRTDEALEISPQEFARRTVAGLGESFDGGLEPDRARRFRGHYEGAAVSATGTTETGVKQDVTVVVLRRERLANFTAVIAANIQKPTEPAVRLAEKALGTLRSQPVGAGGG